MRSLVTFSYYFLNFHTCESAAEFLVRWTDEHSPVMSLVIPNLECRDSDAFSFWTLLQVCVNLHCRLFRKKRRNLVFHSYPQRYFIIFPSAVFCPAKKPSTIVRAIVDLILMPFMLNKTLPYFPGIVLSLAVATCHAYVIGRL